MVIALERGSNRLTRWALRAGLAPRAFALLETTGRRTRVRAVARQRGTSVANVIREALDRGLPATQRRRAAAARRILEAAPMEVGDLSASWMNSAGDTRDRP